MYGWIWQTLPGSWKVKLPIIIGLVLLILALLFFVVFPWIETNLPMNDVVVDQ